MIEGIIVGVFATFVVGMIGFFVRSAITDFSTDIRYRLGLLSDGAKDTRDRMYDIQTGLRNDIVKLSLRVARIENLMGDMGTGD